MSRRSKPVQIICQWCEKSFLTDSYKAKNCSQECVKESVRASIAKNNAKKSAGAKIQKNCAVCKKAFSIIRCHDKDHQTCSKRCKRKLMSMLMKGRRTNERQFTPEDTIKSHIAQQSSSLCGRFDTHHSAEKYKLLSPEGISYSGCNLKNFVRKNNVFWIQHCGNEETIRKISAQLSHLRPWRKHPFKSVHGWTWES